MAIKLPTQTEDVEKKEDLEPEVDPAPEPVDPPAPSKAEEELQRLREENERLKQAPPQPPSPSKEPEPEPEDANFKQWQESRSRVLADMRLSDDEFEQHYKRSKADARFEMAEIDRQWESLRTNEKLAKAEANNQLIAKYGKDYLDAAPELKSVIRNLAPEIRQDPAKLEKELEWRFKAIQADRKPTPKKEPAPQRRIVDSGFERPNPAAPPEPAKRKESNEIPEEFRPFCSAFGIETEQERKQYMSDNILMDFGNGTTFQDPRKGIQRKKAS